MGDGRRYEGSFANDKKEGYGEYYWADGKAYKGKWLDGKQHGEGIYIRANGKERKGLWEAGKRIRWLDEGLSTQKSDMQSIK